MNMMDTETRFGEEKAHSEYMTEFKEKNDYEVKINTAWRRAEPQSVENLLEHSQISAELNQRIYDLAFNLAHTLRERKSSAGKAGIIVARSKTRAAQFKINGLCRLRMGYMVGSQG